jgi:hypothetical protein
VHALTLVWVLNDPLAHDAQLRSFVLEAGGVDTNVPAEHDLWMAQEEALAEVENEPGSHLAHSRLLVAVPTLLTNSPARQLFHDEHDVALEVVLYVPLAQALQRRSAVAEPGVPTDCPGLQVVHATHAVAGFLSWSQVPFPHATGAASAPAQYWPAEHAAQVGMVVAVPGAT